MHKALLAILAAAALLIACVEPSSSSASLETDAARTTPAVDPLDVVRGVVDGDGARPAVVAVLSPT